MHRRHRRYLATIALLLAVAVFALAPVAWAGGQPFRTTLSGANEVPGPGDPDGTGSVSLTLNRGTGEVCWSFSVQDITLPAIAAHIHVAPAGVAGPVVVTLRAPGEDGTSSGCTTADRDLVKAITKDPSAYYVNVHTVDFPAGALRGQLG
jgi:hypothetical protein